MPSKRIMRAINKQIMTTCKSRKALVVVYKEALTALSGKAKTLQQQAKHLSVSHRVVATFEGSAEEGQLCKERHWDSLCCGLSGVHPQIRMLKL